MKLRTYQKRGRTGFTLIELIVVVLIIAMLASMLVAAAAKVIIRAKQVRTRSDISQFEPAIQSFQTTYNVNYIPSSIILDESGAVYSTPLGQASWQYLTRVFGRNIQRNIPWTGGVTPYATLQGHQCLVFFLGGINGTQGFSLNPQNPADPTYPGRKGPFFEFDVSRFVPQGVSYPGYQDGFGKNVYAYFSSYSGVGTYNPNDCSSIPGGGPKPYLQTSNQYYKPDRCQIISAGADGVFGPGGMLWTPATAANIYPASPTPGGADDMANFYDSLLGVPQ